MVTKKTPKVVLTAVAIVIAAYILSPFYLVLINTFKNANGIVANPVSFVGAALHSLRQIFQTLSTTLTSVSGVHSEHLRSLQLFPLYYLLYLAVWLHGLSAVTRQNGQQLFT